MNEATKDEARVVDAGNAAKPPERLRREEFFLMPWRLIMLAATCWAGYYAYLGMFAPARELQRLADETIHASIQFGLTIFIAIELVYYLYISYTFRQCREWGMGVWGAALIVFVLSLKFAI